jgi:hypothetical protein
MTSGQPVNCRIGTKPGRDPAGMIPDPAATKSDNWKSIKILSLKAVEAFQISFTTPMSID